MAEEKQITPLEQLKSKTLHEIDIARKQSESAISALNHHERETKICQRAISQLAGAISAHEKTLEMIKSISDPESKPEPPSSP